MVLSFFCDSSGLRLYSEDDFPQVISIYDFIPKTMGFRLNKGSISAQGRQNSIAFVYGTDYHGILLVGGRDDVDYSVSAYCIDEIWSLVDAKFGKNTDVVVCAGLTPLGLNFEVISRNIQVAKSAEVDFYYSVGKRFFAISGVYNKNISFYRKFEVERSAKLFGKTDGKIISISIETVRVELFVPSTLDLNKFVGSFIEEICTRKYSLTALPCDYESTLSCTALDVCHVSDGICCDSASQYKKFRTISGLSRFDKRFVNFTDFCSAASFVPYICSKDRSKEHWRFGCCSCGVLESKSFKKNPNKNTILSEIDRFFTGIVFTGSEQEYVASNFKEYAAVTQSSYGFKFCKYLSCDSIRLSLLSGEELLGCSCLIFSGKCSSALCSSLASIFVTPVEYVGSREVKSIHIHSFSVGAFTCDVSAPTDDDAKEIITRWLTDLRSVSGLGYDTIFSEWITYSFHDVRCIFSDTFCEFLLSTHGDWSNVVDYFLQLAISSSKDIEHGTVFRVIDQGYGSVESLTIDELRMIYNSFYSSAAFCVGGDSALSDQFFHSQSLSSWFLSKTDDEGGGT